MTKYALWLSGFWLPYGDAESTRLGLDRLKEACLVGAKDVFVIGTQ